MVDAADGGSDGSKVDAGCVPPSCPGTYVSGLTGKDSNAGTPKAPLHTISAAIKIACDSPDFVAKFKETSTIVTYKSPAEYAENLKTNLQKYADATKLSGIELE